jgi:putative NADH-flavin reductase
VAEPDHTTTIIAQLAAVGEQIAGIRRDLTRQDQTFELERQESHLSRKELHEKVNAVVEDVATIRGDIKLAAQVTAQTRETVDDLKKTVEAAAPTIAQVEQAKVIGIWILGGGGAAAIASGLAVLACGEQIKAWFAHWLGISH